MIDSAVGKPTEQQLRVGLTGALDTRPAIVRIGASQVGQIDVDRMCMDVDEAGGVGQLSVDDWLRATGVGRVGSSLDYVICIHNTRCICIMLWITDVRW